LQILWGRQCSLLTHLGSRGHAAMEKILIQAESTSRQADTHDKDTTGKGFKAVVNKAMPKAATDRLMLPAKWSQWIKLIRMHPEWSALNHSSKLSLLKNGPDKSSESYRRMVNDIVQVFRQPI
jgi:hypothetical protein